MSSACCTLPPVEATYTPKGTYTTLANLKTYTIGPEASSAKGAIVYVYDIFGFSPQILQGADLLASLGFRVVMPDFFLGKPASADMFSGTPEANEKKAAFFSGFPGAFTSQSKPIGDVLKALKDDGVKSVGAIGACWGYKAIVSTEELGGFAAVVGVHPSFAAEEDAEKINAPLCLIPTSGEDMSVINKIKDAVEKKNPGKNVVEHYPDQLHGFMAARADLEDEKVKKAYGDAYHTVGKFFSTHL